MKKVLLILMCILGLQLSFAQVNFVGNPIYGRMQNFVYDDTIANKIYATTNVDKHILVSNDNGITWNVLYTLPYPTQAPNIRQMQLTNNGTALSFIEDFGATGLSKVSVLSLNSLNIIKQFNLPPGEINAIGGYSIYDDGTMNTAILIVKDSSSGPIAYNRKLFYTINGGTTWSNVYDSDQLILSDAKLDPKNPQTIYIARGTGPGSTIGGFFKSTDAGATWTETLNGVILESLDVDPKNQGILYTSTAHFVAAAMPSMHQAVYKSTDGGSTWAEQTGIDWSSNDPLGTLRNIKMVINPNNTSHVLALGAHKIAVTTDAGNTWTTTFHDGLVDGTSYFYGFGATFNPFNTNQVMIANERFPKRSTNSGVTLTTIPNPFYTNMGNINIVQDNLIYGVQYGYAVRNLNTNQETPTTVYPLGSFPLGQIITPFFVDKNIPGRSYIFDNVSFPRAIKLSNDYGATSTQILETYDNRLTATGTDPSNPNIVWAATYNGGTPVTKIDFTNISNPIITDLNFPQYPYDYSISGIKINPTNSNTAMVTIGNSIYKTTDGGTTWNETTIPGLNLPDYITDFTQNPLDTTQYTVATTNGIYTSTDSGNTWTQLYNDRVTKVIHSTAQKGQIIGITNTTPTSPSKVVYSNDYGVTWQEKNSSNYFNTYVLDGDARFVNSTTIEVYLTTYSLGILKDVINFSSLGTSEPGITKDDISIYPNPVQDFVNIKLGKNVSKFNISIYNTAGQLLLQTENKTSLDISRLSKGVYFLKIDQDKTSTIIKKIIKK
ncbi:T9SS type A sorting domain-containing protein [Chryseobacterium sp. PMSZPI]|uniref:T9SS type A sorting domain-containing protein n=1 Tax=Chryseobacterium sp. PMSZPI TaxID=1033900 RepID=UPI000C344E62|nr:T9SS type A sorting domain-containing protein [Chryseobacterium sp. PMSZPI]PKF76119.1 hypothetical protein CW752_00595 [Chryseobacterium sp. PMSZPI]